jgi:hypothetical protein
MTGNDEIYSSRNIALADTIRPGVNWGLDFVTIEELRKRTGVAPEAVLPFALSEMLCNALDKEATEINIDIQPDGEFDRLSVSDNGSKKLSRPEIELILDFGNKASSKRGFLRVSRGSLGNALKCIFGYSYALAESNGLLPPSVTITSAKHQYKLSLIPDRIRKVVNTEITPSNRKDDGHTIFTVKFPRNDRSASNLHELKNIIFATGMVNPTRRVSFNLYGEKKTLGTAQQNKAIRQETSVSWYSLKQFTDLFESFLMTDEKTQLKDFISMFKGFTGRKAIREILQETSNTNHDSQVIGSMQFFPTSPLKDLPDQYVRRLFVVMKTKTKPIGRRSVPGLLGVVGEKNFREILRQRHWQKVRYVLLKGFRRDCPECSGIVLEQERCQNIDHVEYPYLVEVAVFDRGDEKGLEVHHCVNFMASMHQVFSDTFDVQHRLGLVGIRAESSVTVIIHLVCPVLSWLNYGKSALANIDSCGLIKKAFDKFLPIPKTPRIYHSPSPRRPLSWIPHGKIGDVLYEERLRSFAAEVRALDSQRTYPVKPSSRGWCYLIEGLGKIHKGEFDACQKAINDCRKIGLLPIDFVAEDQDVTRHFSGIHNASDPAALIKQTKESVEEMLSHLPSDTTDYWQGEKFYVMMCVEKGDLLNLFKPICDQYHVPIVSSKGWAPILLRSHIANLAKKAEDRGLTPVLLLFYDHDPAGLKITQTFRKNLEDCRRGTRWNPGRMILERFGLNKDDIEKFNLTWIDNLKTSSGRESQDYEYIERYGTRKCEANALFKNDETLRAGVEICRKAIEKYYGPEAKERFRRKEENSREKLKQIYDDPVWASFNTAINNILDSLLITKAERNETQSGVSLEKEIDVFVDNKYCGLCPDCETQFNYSKEDVGRLVRCRTCKCPMRLKWKTNNSPEA